MASLRGPYRQLLDYGASGQRYSKPRAVRHVLSVQHFLASLTRRRIRTLVQQRSIDVSRQDSASTNSVRTLLGIDGLSETKQAKFRNDIGGTGFGACLFGRIRNDVNDGA